MSYPERKPIYDAYKSIVSEIVKQKAYKQYAKSEINALDESLLQAFKEIAFAEIESKIWPKPSNDGI
jgi:hypothetical protein